MTIDTEAAKAVGIDPERVRAAVDLLHQLEQGGEERRAACLAFVRGLAELARENQTARAVVVASLDRIAPEVGPEAAAIFRAVYLEGERRPAMREVANRFYMDNSTGHRKARRVFDALTVLLFGVDGVTLETPQEAHSAPLQRFSL